ncbi:MAG: hypothetical protein KF900_11735 [Bacteroidetes bacterium]|nr:hypothetical protein [Bacteroidota bacterium]
MPHELHEGVFCCNNLIAIKKQKRPKPERQAGELNNEQPLDCKLLTKGSCLQDRVGCCGESPRTFTTTMTK